MPLILSGNVASATAAAYDVANSCRFNSGDSPELKKSTATPTSTRIFTISAWVKKCNPNISGPQSIFSISDDASGDYTDLRYHHTAESLMLIDYQDSTQMNLTTTRSFRDPSAWMHVCVAVDSTQSTASNRVKFYFNGVQETSFSTETDPDQNHDFKVDGTYTRVGYQYDQYYFDGYLAEVVLIDGQALAPTSFGEFDSDSPTIWKPIDVSGLTFGNNGFYLDFEASDNLGNDANGGTDFTEANLDATDQATDTPTNNFATFNPLFPISGDTLSEGNVKVQTSDSNYSPSSSSIGVASGKWYAEVKYTAHSSVSALMVGVTSNPSEDARNDDSIGEQSYSYGYNSANGESYTGGWSGTSYGDSFTVDDIIGITLNLDDNELIFYKNGAVQNSGTALSITAAASTTSGFYHFAISDTTTNYNITAEINFGNPSFSISSGNADANGYGNFEYAVPNGFYALCTKNLAEYG